MAFINVRNYRGRGFRCPVEDKHKYTNGTFGDLVLKIGSMSAGDGVGCTFSYSSFKKVNISESIPIAQGIADNQRIGNKVYMKYIDLYQCYKEAINH